MILLKEGSHNLHHQQEWKKKWKDTPQYLEIRNVVAAFKWETSDGSMHINSVNFVYKCNFSKFYCFWVLGPLLQKVWVEDTPPIVGECVYICIEKFQNIMTKFMIFYFEKKVHVLFKFS